MTDPSVKPKFSLGRLIIALFGLTLLVIGMAWGLSSWYFSKDAQTAVGTITEMNYEGGGDAMRPTFLFYDSEGNPHVAKSNSASSSYEYLIGDEVPILYNFRVSEEVRIEGWLNSWGTGAVVGLVGLWLLSRARRRNGNATPTVASEAATAKPWVDANTDDAKQALVSAIMLAAGKSSVAKTGSVAKAAAKNVSSVPKTNLAPAPKRAWEPTVRRMR